MRWKEIFIGAAVTFMVTVIGGLLVYFFTQEKENPSIEMLSYQIDKQVSFTGSSNQISIGSLKFSNIGSEPAKNVSAEFHSKTAEILEFKITNEGGAEIDKTISKDKSSVSLNVKTLLPNEIVSITYLLNKESSLEFKMRSERSIGKPGAIYKVEKSRSSILNDFFGDFIPFLIFIAIMPLFFMFKFLRRSISIGSSKNNIGFVLLHTGQPDEAVTVLKHAIENGEDGSHALANYAAALAVQDELDKSQKYIEAARFLARTKHEIAICDFNNTIIEHVAGNNEKSQSFFKSALSLSKSEILSYAEKSLLLKEMIVKNVKLKEIMNNA